MAKTNKYKVADVPLIPLDEEIIINIYDVYYGKWKNITVIFEYEDKLYQFSVFWNNRYSTVDESFSFKILDENKQLIPPTNKLVAKFDLTKSGYLKCLSARILDE